MAAARVTFSRVAPPRWWGGIVGAGGAWTPRRATWS